LVNLNNEYNFIFRHLTINQSLLIKRNLTQNFKLFLFQNQVMSNTTISQTTHDGKESCFDEPGQESIVTDMDIQWEGPLYVPLGISNHGVERGVFPFTP
ncbi:hypothetical protein L9F63_007902, partial [Diploptera punctata]